ncbi:MAG: spermine synthase [Bacteroidetes bacterium HGW-Bacteroidetes-2]|nr:MAG: spermine synthase [Bacteroidetes bacterium HGW-Bacteroidetes-2]
MKRLFSYLYPFRLKNYSSKINGSLEINLVDGKKVLDTSISNFSYGSLQKILQTGLKKIDFNKNTKQLLLLGLGGGCVIETIREKFKSDAIIVAVEIDPKIITIANDDFNIKRFENIQIIQADAADYIKTCTKSFDIIIVDIFIGNEVPKPFTEDNFLRGVPTLLNDEGKIMFNVMRETMLIERYQNIQDEFKKAGLIIRVFERVDGTNDLIIAEKTKSIK